MIANEAKELAKTRGYGKRDLEKAKSRPGSQVDAAKKKLSDLDLVKTFQGTEPLGFDREGTRYFKLTEGLLAGESSSPLVQLPYVCPSGNHACGRLMPGQAPQCIPYLGLQSRWRAPLLHVAHAGICVSVNRVIDWHPQLLLQILQGINLCLLSNDVRQCHMYWRTSPATLGHGTSPSGERSVRICILE